MGATLGTLTVDLAATTVGFTRGMAKAERASQRWRKKVTRDINRVGKGMRLLALTAVSGLVSSFLAVSSASARQADAIQQLETRLKSTGGAAGKSSEELQKMAAALQGVTRFVAASMRPRR